jgi:hypothetical protein
VLRVRAQNGLIAESRLARALAALRVQGAREHVLGLGAQCGRARGGARGARQALALRRVDGEKLEGAARRERPRLPQRQHDEALARLLHARTSASARASARAGAGRGAL